MKRNSIIPRYRTRAKDGRTRERKVKEARERKNDKNVREERDEEIAGNRKEESKMIEGEQNEHAQNGIRRITTNLQSSHSHLASPSRPLTNNYTCSHGPSQIEFSIM